MIWVDKTRDTTFPRTRQSRRVEHYIFCCLDYFLFSEPKLFISFLIYNNVISLHVLMTQSLELRFVALKKRSTRNQSTLHDLKEEIP